MEILTLKDLDTVWLVNNKYTVPKSQSNKDYAVVQAAIAAGIVVEPQYTQAELDAQVAEAAEEATAGQVRATTALKNFMQAGPTGIETYIDTNVTDLASAKQVITTLAKIVWVVARREFK